MPVTTLTHQKWDDGSRCVCVWSFYHMYSMLYVSIMPLNRYILSNLFFKAVSCFSGLQTHKQVNHSQELTNTTVPCDWNYHWQCKWGEFSSVCGCCGNIGTAGKHGKIQLCCSRTMVSVSHSASTRFIMAFVHRYVLPLLSFMGLCNLKQPANEIGYTAVIPCGQLQLVSVSQ